MASNTNKRKTKSTLNSSKPTTPKMSNSEKEALGADLATLLMDALNNGGDPFQNFIGLTSQLKQKQDELDVMAADSLPAAILTDYVSDVLLPNSNGDLVSVVANQPEHQMILNGIYQRLALPGEKIVYSILKNGIVIGQFEQVTQKSLASQVAANEAITDGSATEGTYVRQGTILPNISIIPDTYTVFPILKYEKCVAFIEVKKDKDFFNEFNWETDTINYTDVIIHPTTDYCYETFGVPHSSKPLQLRILNENNEIDVYDIAVGCSMLEDAYSAWRTLSLLQDSVVLASLIKNAQIMLVEVEGGTATKQQIEAAKLKLRSLFEGQLSMGRNGMKSYLSPQSKPAFIYSFTSNGVGKITASLVGGEYNPGQLYYLTPFVNQFFAAMRAPKQNYGFTEGAGGLDGGGAVEQYNQRYKSTVARIKRLYASFIKKCINNVLMSKNLVKLVNNFDVKVYGAYDETRNQEAQEQQTKLALFESIINFMQIEDPEQQKNLRSAMLKQVITDPALMDLIDQTLTAKPAPPEEGSIDDLGDTQLSEDVADELDIPLDTNDSIDTAQSGETQPEELELPEMSETLTNEEE